MAKLIFVNNNAEVEIDDGAVSKKLAKNRVSPSHAQKVFAALALSKSSKVWTIYRILPTPNWTF